MRLHRSRFRYARTTILLLLLLSRVDSFCCIGSFSSKQQTYHHGCLFANPNDDRRINDAALQEMEQQVLASAKAQVDYNQLVKALSSEANEATPAASSAIIKEPPDDVPTSAYASAPLPWQVSLAASSVVSVATLFLFQNLYFSLVCFALVLALSFKDPVDDDNLFGALARILGRQTLKSYPAVKAVARAAVTGQEEVILLQQRIQSLEQENQDLREWKEIRETAEQYAPDYSVAELKDLAREYGLPVGGTKLQLMVRVLENKALVIAEANPTTIDSSNDTKTGWW